MTQPANVCVFETAKQTVWELMRPEMMMMNVQNKLRKEERTAATPQALVSNLDCSCID